MYLTEGGAQHNFTVDVTRLVNVVPGNDPRDKSIGAASADLQLNIKVPSSMNDNVCFINGVSHQYL